MLDRQTTIIIVIGVALVALVALGFLAKTLMNTPKAVMTREIPIEQRDPETRSTFYTKAAVAEDQKAAKEFIKGARKMDKSIEQIKQNRRLRDGSIQRDAKEIRDRLNAASQY